MTNYGTLQYLLDEKDYSIPMQKALRLFIDGELSHIVLAKEMSTLGKSVEELHTEALDVIIDFVEQILDDDILTEEEMDTLRLLKLYFKVREGDFLKQHKEQEIENILTRQLDTIFRDNKVDKDEALHKVNLQELFGLSYDQFLQFERTAVERAIESGADIKELDTFYRNDN